MSLIYTILARARCLGTHIWNAAKHCLSARVYIGRYRASVPEHSIIFFPCDSNILCCGLACVVSFKPAGSIPEQVPTEIMQSLLDKVDSHRLSSCREKSMALESCYLGDDDTMQDMLSIARNLKRDGSFVSIYRSNDIQEKFDAMASHIREIIIGEEQSLGDNMGFLESSDVDVISRRIDNLKDIGWCITQEVSDNIAKVQNLAGSDGRDLSPSKILFYKKINAVLNSIDRLEVRGRDSAGISLLFILEHREFAAFRDKMEQTQLLGQFHERTSWNILVNNCIAVHEQKGNRIGLTFVYKVASEIGSLGDNVSFLRSQIHDDEILKILVTRPAVFHTVSAHTRWASVGGISMENCHPLDNEASSCCSGRDGIIHVCLNGDIDNYQELKGQFENRDEAIPDDITTDTKIIPLHIRAYLKEGHDVKEAFRLAVSDFDGSHAITMHTDLEPGKMFLAQKGSGQAIFVGIAEELYMPTSEVYGFVEETPRYIKLDGDKVIEGKAGPTQGQIFILNQGSTGGLEGIEAMYYDSTPIDLNQDDIKETEITSRDIDRQDFPHYFLKEISESPASVEKTLQNCWKAHQDFEGSYVVSLDEKVIPPFLQDELVANRIKRIFFVGQGTAGVAALVCADILNYYLNDPYIQVSSLKASELSGFKLISHQPDSMADTLTIAITQSGTTTDTNRTVDMLRERGGRTIAIVNRRDSDITFKVDGVLYTSSGRDVEMSVASTKAFYSQIVAGAMMGLHIAHLKGRRSDAFVTEEIKQLSELPGHMRSILAMRDRIGASAYRLAASRTYWAVVGSGPNKASADEIRIKLSELCYKTISSDFVEDKKHIDLSSEPLIIVCAAGTRPNVIGDIIKDTAIFQAHKAIPVVIADEGEDRFDLYAEDVFHVPPVSEHIAPIINTLAGHIWGYYAALAINEGSRFLHSFREKLQAAIARYTKTGMDIYEIVLEKKFRETLASFYTEFRKKKAEGQFPAVMGIEASANLTLLLKYLTGRLPVSDFELDFKKSGSPINMINELFECLGESINCMARPVDAIKHQAKTVTVGTSRIIDKIEGVLFEALAEHDITVSHISSRNIIVLKNIQSIVSHINGSTLYKISGLNLLNEPTDETRIEVLEKRGSLGDVASRVEQDHRLQGTKKIIVQEGNVYIGTGLSDGRSIIIIPAIPESVNASYMVENMLLLNISFNEDVDLSTKKKALGGKYERIKNLVQENRLEWEDSYLELVAMSDLFGSSAEKIAEVIVGKQT